MRIIVMVVAVLYLIGLLFLPAHAGVMYMAGLLIFCWLIAECEDNPLPVIIWVVLAVLADGMS